MILGSVLLAVQVPKEGMAWKPWLLPGYTHGSHLAASDGEQACRQRYSSQQHLHVHGTLNISGLLGITDGTQIRLSEEQRQVTVRVGHLCGWGLRREPHCDGVRLPLRLRGHLLVCWSHRGVAGPLHIQGQALHLITSTDQVSGSGQWPAAVQSFYFKPLCASAIVLLENELVTLMGMTVGFRISTSTVATSPQIQQMLPASEAGATGCSLPFTFTFKHHNVETLLLDRIKRLQGNGMFCSMPL